MVGFSRTLFVLAAALFSVLSSQLPAAAQTCTEPPNAPADVTANRQGTQGGVLVTWRDPTDGVCRATRFYLEVSQNGQHVREFAITPVGADGSTQFVQVPNVQYGGLWRFAVRSFNQVGISTQTSAFVNDVSAGCFQMPDPVTEIVASASGRVVTIQWLHPGSCTLTGFVIEAADSAGRVVYTSEAFQNPAMRSFSANAPPGTWYVRVYAESHRRLTAPSPWVSVSVQ